MNLLAGIIVAVSGLIVTALGLFKIVPGLTWTGFCLISLGGLTIGLSFVPKPETNETPRMSTLSTLINIFFSPSEVFQNLRRHPRWLVAAMIMTILAGVYLNLFMYRLTPEVVTNFAIDKTLEMPMLANNEEAKKNIEAGRAQAIADNKNPVLKGAQSVNSFVGQVFLTAIIALVFFVFALAMGGKMNFWQAFSVAVYASFPVAVIRFVLNTVILYNKEPDQIHPILGQGSLIYDSLNFLVLPGEHPVIYTILSTFSVLSFYWIYMYATGLKNGGEKVSPTTAWSATLTLFFIGMCFAIFMSWAFAGFLG